MNFPSDEEMCRELLNRAKAVEFSLRGPAETAYGWGWSPTTSFWSGNRRVHFYFDIAGKRDGLVVEIAELYEKVLLGTVQDMEQAWTVIDLFLRQEQSFEQMPDLGWEVTTLDANKFIPHPPDKDNPANIVSFIKRPDVVPWQPPKVENAPKPNISNVKSKQTEVPFIRRLILFIRHLIQKDN
jgi:hypothetical protein